MDFIKKPMEIENRSMEIIAPHLQGLNLSEDQVKVYSRIIHAAGDVEYAPIIRLHPWRKAAIFILMWKWCGQVLTSGSWQPLEARYSAR